MAAAAMRGGSVARLAEPGDALAEIWLGRIAETPHGFSGFVAESGAPHIRIGERMRFARIHVVGWTTG